MLLMNNTKTYKTNSYNIKAKKKMKLIINNKK